MSPYRSPLARGLDRLAAFSVRRPRRVVIAALVAVALALLASSQWLGLKTSNLDLIDGDLGEVQAFRRFAADFGSPNPLVVVLAGGEPEALRAAATAILVGLAVAWPGHLTLLSSFFGSIVFGMGVDFGILIVDRLEERLAEGEPVSRAIVAAIEALSPGLSTGALTTSMGFFAMQATGFRGFAELGWLAGLGIVVSPLLMVTLLPALLVLVPQRHGRERLVSPTGPFAVYAYLKGDIWQPAVRDRFLARMRAINPQVTGMPFLGHFMIELSHRALKIAGGLALLILVVCVTADLRDLRLALLALLPTLLGLAAMRGLMQLLGVSFNPLNIMALPVVIGVGEDNAVHLLHRLLEERGSLARALAGTGRSILLTSGTTVASFVALSFASHQGLASFALALALGIGSTLAMSLLVLPQLAAWLLPRLGARPEPGGPGGSSGSAAPVSGIAPIRAAARPRRAGRS